jgi:outer membrane protein
MTTKKCGFIWGPIAVLLALAAAGSVHAQANIKVGVVNVGRLLEQAPQTQRAMQALEAEFAPRQRDLVAQQTELQEKQETFRRDASVMGEAERLSLEREIRDGTRDLQRADAEFREDYNIRRNEELGELQRSLLTEVQSFARAEGYDLVVSDVLYYSSGVDITADVLESMQSSAGRRNGGGE